jgi:hypothetical protein
MLSPSCRSQSYLSSELSHHTIGLGIGTSELKVCITLRESILVWLKKRSALSYNTVYMNTDIASMELGRRG